MEGAHKCLLKIKAETMQSIIITPKNKEEYRFIQELIDKMKLNYAILCNDDKEDLVMSMLMRKADRSVKVSREAVMKKLHKK